MRPRRLRAARARGIAVGLAAAALAAGAGTAPAFGRPPSPDPPAGPPRPPAPLPRALPRLAPAPPAAADVPARAAPTPLPIVWRTSRIVGEPSDGRLERGVLLPAEGPSFFTWDDVLGRVPNRPGRRWGSDRLIRILLAVAADYRRRAPGAPRVAVGDLSRRGGGPFGSEFGGLGHASHQNGVDVDVYYPRRDRRERGPGRLRDVDRRLAQELVDAWVRAGAERVFVGPRVGLRGPPDVVQVLPHHDDHLHARIPYRRAARRP